MAKLGDLQQGRVVAQPERTPPATEDWWRISAGVNLSTFGYPDNFDSGNDFVLVFYIDKNVRKILEVGLTLKFQKFRAYTIPSSHSHTVTIGNHTHTIGNHNHTVGNHTHGVTTSNHTHTVGNHTHSWSMTMNNSSSGNIVRLPGPGSYPAFNVSGGGAIGGVSTSSGGATTSSSGGGEGLTSASGGATTSSSGGATTTSSGGATTPSSSTTAGATYGIFEDTYPVDVNIDLDGTDITANLGGPWSPTGGSDTFTDLDLTPFITEGGLHVITLDTTQRGRCLPLLWVKSIISR